MKLQPKKYIFADASSLILLYKAGLVDCLTEQYKVVAADGVFKEITRQGHDGAGYFKNHPDIIRFGPKKTDQNIFGNTSMGDGEAQTLGLYQSAENKCSGFILVDDGKAARFCKKNKLPFINALVVPKILFYAGITTETICLEAMQFISCIGRYSGQIRDKAHQMTRKDLNRFLP